MCVVDVANQENSHVCFHSPSLARQNIDLSLAPYEKMRSRMQDVRFKAESLRPRHTTGSTKAVKGLPPSQATSRAGIVHSQRT
jgi:hypothetical protein